MATGKGPLRRAIDSWYEDFNLGKRFGGWLRENSEHHNDRLGEAYKQFFDELGVDSSNAPFLRPGSPPAIAGGIVAVIPMLLGMLLGAGMGIGISVISPLTLSWSYGVARKVRPWRPDPILLEQMRYRFPNDAALLDSYQNDNGVPDNVKGILSGMARQRIGVTDWVSLWLRNSIDEGRLNTELKKFGIGDQEIAYIKELSQVIPSPNDLVSMAVREAFDDSIANQFQYDENFPAEFGVWAERQGLSIEWARRYWRAHWQLPSPNQVFEMFHRLRPGKVNNSVDENELSDYLRIADIAPFWRSRLKDISYNPITRVDVRRMYTLLGWSREELVGRYRDLGYSPQDAENYADFTIRYETPNEQGLTQSAILTAYRRKVLNQSETLEALSDIGIRDDIARFYVSLEDKQERDKVVAAQLDIIEDLYLLGELDDATVYNQLGPLDLTGEQANRIVLGWATKRKKKQVLPTKSELDRWYKFELIDQNQYRNDLLKRNIHPDFVDLYIAETDIDISNERDKEFERVQKEQLRINKERRSSQYQKDKAELDVQMAEVAVSIADMKVAVFLADDPDEIDLLKERILIMQGLLAKLRLAKASLKSDLEEQELNEVQNNG